MATDKHHIVIAGAGIGGLTASLCLASAGYRITLCEKAQKLSEIGAGIQISPNAGRVLAGLGLAPAMARAAVEPPSIEVRNAANGRYLAKIPTDIFRKRYGYPYQVIHRADLQSVLAKAVSINPQVNLHLGTGLEDVLTQPDRVLLRLHKGPATSAATAAAVIGADGVWSTLRETIAPRTEAVPTGQTAWRTIIPADVASEFVATDRVALWLAPNAHLVHYPVAQGAAVNIVVIVDERSDQRSWSTHASRSQIIGRLAGWAPEAVQLVQSAINWQKFPMNTVDPTAPWVGQRAALLGDAAHAMLPFLAQGAAMAIEDSAVLAHCLQSTDDIQTGLASYAAARQPRVTRLAAAAARTGRLYHYGSAMGAARNLALRVGGGRLLMFLNDWIYTWQPPEPKHLDQ